MYERFTDRSRKVMQLANQEAQRFNHEYIGTDHMLLGLIKEGSGTAATLLKNLDIDLRKVRLEVEKRVQHGPGDMKIMGRLPHTPRAKKVIEYAIDEARQMNQNYVGTEHILFGLVREEEGLAAQILKEMGVTMDQLKRDYDFLIGRETKKPAPKIVVEEIDEELDKLYRLKEEAVMNQDFELATKYRDDADEYKRKKKSEQMTKLAEALSATAENEHEDADARHRETLKQVAYALMLHYTGDWSAGRVVEEIQSILKNN